MKPSESVKVTALVPAYNEERGIKNVLTTLKGSLFINEVVFVNDGSTDNTLNIAKSVAGIKIVNLSANHGKGYAISKGIQNATGDIIVFVDGDLRGLNDSTIVKLTHPLLSGKYRVSIGYPDSHNFDKFFRPLSGERAYFRKDLLPHIEKLKNKGFGLELYLNYLFRNRKIKLFPLKELSHSLKHEKYSYELAAKLTVVESFDLIAEVWKQKNPLSYLMKAYFFPFYFKKGSKKKLSLEKFTQYVKKSLIETFNI